MKVYDLHEYLSNKSYPGRGILMGTDEAGKYGVIAYFIMGRSENSRNRVFVKEGDGIRTKVYDQSKVTDPSLIIYSPVRVFSRSTIVTNGDQTDTIYDALERFDAVKHDYRNAFLTDNFESTLAARAFTEALATRTFEPDAPNYTPRISGLFLANGDFSSYRLSILKSSGGNPITCQRFFFSYENKLPGTGHLIHTYQVNEDPLPSFEGDPRPVTIRGNIDTFTANLWRSLNEENKVALFVRFINLSSLNEESRIINANENKRI
jgi:IMP cyclohydrolase